jgi:DNA-binding HxlR family transcriptional regulator
MLRDRVAVQAREAAHDVARVVSCTSTNSPSSHVALLDGTQATSANWSTPARAAMHCSCSARKRQSTAVSSAGTRVGGRHSPRRACRLRVRGGAACRRRAVLEARAVVALVGGPKRHADLLRMIEGVSQRMLTQTLRVMERDGLVERRVLDPSPRTTSSTASRRLAIHSPIRSSNSAGGRWTASKKSSKPAERTALHRSRDPSPRRNPSNLRPQLHGHDPRFRSRVRVRLTCESRVDDRVWAGVVRAGDTSAGARLGCSWFRRLVLFLVVRPGRG